MVDEVITKQELIDAQKDAQSLDDFINGGDEEVVITRLLKEYPTLANAIRQIYEKGGKFYPTLAAANADIANIRTDVYVITGDNGAYHKATAGATSLTKSPYDPARLAISESTKRAIFLDSIKSTKNSKLESAQFEKGDVFQVVNSSAVIHADEMLRIADVNITNNTKLHQTLSIDDVDFILMPSDVINEDIITSKYVDFLITDDMSVSVVERDTVFSVKINFDTSSYSVAGTDRSNALDTSGIYTPTPAIEPNTSFLSVSATSEGLQFNIPKTLLASSGYGNDAKQLVIDTLGFIKIRIRHTTQTIQYNAGIDGKLLGLMSHTVDFNGNTGSFGLYKEKQAQYMPLVPPLVGQAYTLYSTSVQNNSGLELNNEPIELKVNFKTSEVFSDKQIIVRDRNKNTFVAQFVPDFYANLSKQLSDGFYPDKSFKSGTLIIRDTLGIDEVKHYSILVYQNNVVSYEAEVIESEASNRKVFSAFGCEFKFVKDFVSGNNFVSTKRQDGFELTAICAQMLTVQNPSNPTALANQGLQGSRVISVKNIGYHFIDIECDFICTTHPLKVKQVHRCFNNGDVRIFTISTVTEDFDTTLLYGVLTQLNNNVASTTLSGTLGKYSIMDLLTNETHSYIKALWFHGDIHRDGLAYGPRRREYLAFNGKLMQCGWQDSIDSASSTTWTSIKKGESWSTEVFIKMQETMDYEQFTRKCFNTPVGFVGKQQTWQEKSKALLNDVAEYVLATKEWWYSSDASNVGGNPSSPYSTSIVECADLIDLYRNGKGDFETIYANFIQKEKDRHGSLVGTGASYLAGGFQIALESRITAPNLWWLYKHCQRNDLTTKVDELGILAKSIADAFVTYFDNHGGIGNLGNGTDQGASNVNASAMRFLAIAIAMGLDTAGSYLRVFDAIEALLLNEIFQRTKNFWSDGRNEPEACARYSAYMIYGANSYLLACLAIDREPQIDVSQFILKALNGDGVLRDSEYCISQSRRGGRNSLGMAIQPLIYKRQQGTVNGTIAAFDALKKNGWDQDGYPLRINDYEVTTSSGNLRNDCLYNLSALSDLYLTYYYLD